MKEQTIYTNVVLVFAKNDDGAVAVEYVIVASVMCFALVSLLPGLSGSVTLLFDEVLGYFFS
jgi:Flp pilus assembly pilin Flp